MLNEIEEINAYSLKKVNESKEWKDKYESLELELEKLKIKNEKNE